MRRALRTQPEAGTPRLAPAPVPLVSVQQVALLSQARLLLGCLLRPFGVPHLLCATVNSSLVIRDLSAGPWSQQWSLAHGLQADAALAVVMTTGPEG